MVMHPVACAQGGGVVGVRPGGWYKLQGQWGVSSECSGQAGDPNLSPDTTALTVQVRSR